MAYFLEGFVYLGLRTANGIAPRGLVKHAYKVPLSGCQSIYELIFKTPIEMGCGAKDCLCVSSCCKTWIIAKGRIRKGEFKPLQSICA